jgi:hypothetical protein
MWDADGQSMPEERRLATMPLNAKYLYVVIMDVEPDREALFNEVYDKEHIPVLLKVPGVLAAARYKTSDEGIPRYLAIYELESPDVPHSEAFRKASDSGEWPIKVRPFTKNRSRIVYSQIDGSAKSNEA